MENLPRRRGRSRSGRAFVKKFRSRFGLDRLEKDVAATNPNPLEKDVDVKNLNLAEIMKLPLTIPPYQRIYAWEDDDIGKFWDSARGSPDAPSHLGTIILMRNRENGGLEIVDGQQRLVTLTLILVEMGADKTSLPLLRARYRAKDAVEHIANAKAVIQTILPKDGRGNLTAKLYENLRFTAVIINKDEPDLAYSFFTNQNSNSEPLSDYDLLKARHLPFIRDPDNAEVMAKSWNRLNMKKDGEIYPLARVLGDHIYRMRRMSRHLGLSYSGHYVRDEFQPAKRMREIPPLQGMPEYWEPIQGGERFFTFSDEFFQKYLEFCQTEQAAALWSAFYPEHSYYADIIETLLFAYWLHYGNRYLSETLFCLAKAFQSHRYGYKRAMKKSVMECEAATASFQSIAFSRSLSFFLREILDKFPQTIDDYSPQEVNRNGVQGRFHRRLLKLSQSLPDISINEIKEIIDRDYAV